MKRRTIGEVVFWGAVVLALALYFLTMPNGLPWNPSATENRIWRYLVAMAGGSAMTLTCLSAAGAAGLIGALVNRYLGWRVGLAVAIVWIFMPGVWNRAIIGEQGVVMASAVIVMAWTANAVVLWAFRKARATLKANGAHGVSAMSGMAHDANKKYAKVNSIAGWALLGAAVIFAAVSMSMHDYLLGEAASAYARLIVEEAGERVIMMNGLCDAQIEKEIEKRGGQWTSSAISLKDTDANRSNVVAFAKFAFSNETNIWLEAEVSPIAFADAAVKAHPDRFYTMQGQSTTPEKWAARWEAMKPYLNSRDKFIPAMRLTFAYEGNFLGNGLQEKGELNAAWGLYLRIFTEIHPDNPAACVNLNEMLRRGYKVSVSTRQRIESAQADYAKMMSDKRKAMRVAQYISHFGPVMRDQKAYEELRERVRKHMEELAKKGEKPQMTIPDLKTLEEWHSEMMKYFLAGELDKAVRIARAILSRKAWRTFIPANMVLGEKMMVDGLWTEAEVFMRVVISGKGSAAPLPIMLNDYAETLRQLKRYDEAEKYAREAVEKTDAKKGWLFRMTLAQILRDAGKNPDEMQALVKETLKYAPKESQQMVRKEFPK